MNHLTLVWRGVRSAPVLFSAATTSVALVICASALMLGMIDAMLLRPLPFVDSDRVFVLRMLNTRTGAQSSFVSPQVLQAIVEHLPSRIAIGLRESQTVTPHYDGPRSEWVPTTAVGPTYLQVLGVSAARGRLFEASDASDPGRTAVISYRTWRERFGGDESIIGRLVMLGRTQREIIGVLPRGFMFPSRYFASSARVELGRPQYEYVTLSSAGTRRLNFDPILRLAPGLTRQQAEAELRAIVASGEVAGAGGGMTVPQLVDVRSVIFPTSGRLIKLLAAATAFLLLIGCINVGLLLLARTRGRERDIGICVALGAGRGWVVGTVLMEAVFVALVGTAAAIALAPLVFESFLRQVPPQVYGDAAVGVDWRVVILTFVLAGVSGIVFAVGPAMWALRLDAQALIRGRGRRPELSPHRYPALMIASQAAITLVLVVGAAAAVRAFLSALSTPFGFSTQNVLAATVEAAGPNDARSFYTQAVKTVAQRGDVAAAGAVSHLPLTDFGADETVVSSGQETGVYVVYALPGYFETIGLRLIRGRLLNWDDVREGNNVVVASSAALRLFHSVDAIGRTVETRTGKDAVVVGVVADVLSTLDSNANPPLIYALPPSGKSLMMTVVARTRYRSPEVVAQIRGQIDSLAPGTPANIAYWSEGIGRLQGFQIPRLQGLVFGTLALLAVLQTAVGIFGIVASAVGRRRREIAIRVALGATPTSLQLLFVRRTLLAVTAGLLAGLVLARWLRPIAQATIVGVRSSDWLASLLSVAVVIVMAAVAAYLPARRASRTDANVVLRAD